MFGLTYGTTLCQTSKTSFSEELSGNPVTSKRESISGSAWRLRSVLLRVSGTNGIQSSLKEEKFIIPLLILRGENK